MKALATGVGLIAAVQSIVDVDETVAIAVFIDVVPACACALSHVRVVPVPVAAAALNWLGPAELLIGAAVPLVPSRVFEVVGAVTLPSGPRCSPTRLQWCPR